MYARASSFVLSGAVGAIAAGSATAASVDAAQRWTGLYVGAHASAADGEARNSFSPTIKFDGYGAGARIGYNFGWEGLVVGAEAQASFLDYSGVTDPFFDGKNLTQIDRQLSAEGSLRAKIGLPVEDGRLFENILFYGTAGVAWMHAESNYTDDVAGFGTESKTHTGIVAGGGVEAAINSRLSLLIEVTTTQYDREDYSLPNGINTIQDEIVTGTIGVNWKIGE